MAFVPGQDLDHPWHQHSLVSLHSYRKFPKFSDARNLCCNLPKIQTKGQILWVFCQNCAYGTANSEDPDQTAPNQTAPLGAV